jgi:YVTN family beta-propeller protein
VFDLATRKQIGAVHFEQGVRPHFAVWGPDGNMYVTNEIAKRIAIVNPKTLQVVGTIPTGAESSHNLAISHDGKYVYTSNVFAGTVSVLDVKDRKLVTQIPVATPEQHKATNNRHWQLQRIAISPDGKYVFTCDWDNKDFVAIDRKTNTVTHRVKLPEGCYGADFLDGGKTAVVPIEYSSQVAVIDLNKWQVTHLIDVPKGPQETLVRPDGKMIYVSSAYADEVEFLDPATWTVTKTIKTGFFPDGIAWSRLPPKDAAVSK